MSLFLKCTIKILFVFLLVTPITSTGNENLKPLRPESLVSIQYTEETKSLSLKESELPLQQFSDYKNQELNPDQYYWLKLTFNNLYLPEKEYFIHAYDFFTEISLIQFGPDNYISKSTGGSLIPVAHRSFKGFYKDKVQFKVSDKNETIVYLKIRRDWLKPYTIPSIGIIASKDYNNLKTKNDIFQSFFSGIVFFLCLFNLLLFILTRERIFLAYLIYALVASTYFYFYYDYLEFFIFPESPHFNRHFFFSNLLGQSLYFTFLYHVVKKENIGRYKRWIFNYAVIILLISIADILISFYASRRAVFFSDFLTIINSIVIGLIIVGLFRKVSNTAKMILIGSSILIISGAATIVINLYSYSVYHIFMYQIGFSLELLMFSIALNFSYYNERLIRIKKQLDLERVKTEKLEQEREVVRLNKDIDRKNRDLTYKAIVISQKETMQKDILKQLSAINNQNEIKKENLKQVVSNLKSNINNNHWKEFEGHHCPSTFLQFAERKISQPHCGRI